MTKITVKEPKLLSSVRDGQKKIENFVFSNIIPKFFDSSIRNTRHFREWFKTPMNYCRIMELPLTLELLDLDLNKEQSILDISSPKLLALYLAINGYDILATDLENYFVQDFEVFARKFDVPIKTECFDATTIPYQDDSFDRIFSVSVFEHIPDFGDVDAVKEVARVLKQGGVFVMTLPAYKSYLEEWLKGESFYWRGKKRDDGSVFFQRRFTELTIKERFDNLGLEIEEIIWIAEKPIKEPSLNQNGRLDHNVYYLESLPLAKFFKNITFKFFPLLPYFLYSWYSNKSHYLTKSFDDENIRQVAIKFRKA
jgi:SAM-dependent methyltransferase